MRHILLVPRNTHTHIYIYIVQVDSDGMYATFRAELVCPIHGATG